MSNFGNTESKLILFFEENLSEFDFADEEKFKKIVENVKNALKDSQIN